MLDRTFVIRIMSSDLKKKNENSFQAFYDAWYDQVWGKTTLFTLTVATPNKLEWSINTLFF